MGEDRSGARRRVSFAEAVPAGVPERVDEEQMRPFSKSSGEDTALRQPDGGSASSWHGPPHGGGAADAEPSSPGGRSRRKRLKRNQRDGDGGADGDDGSPDKSGSGAA